MSSALAQAAGAFHLLGDVCLNPRHADKTGGHKDNSAERHNHNGGKGQA
jgi:hypothetical protein